MQPETSYQLLEILGSCQAGKVWSAVDAQGQAIAVAVLEPPYATDQRWRDAFASAAYAVFNQDGDATYLQADFSATEPWVACAAGESPEQIFVALGMDYRPTSAPVQAPSDAPDPPVPPSADLAAGEPTQLLPLATADGSATGQPPLADAPTSGALQSAAVGPVPASTGAPQPLLFPYEPYQPPPPGTPERPRRTGVWVGVGVVLVVALVAVGGFFAWQSTGGKPTAKASSSLSGPAISSSPEPVALPTGAPRHPGVEPPKPGSWPAEPKFADTDQVRIESLEGLGFRFKVPEAWACAPRDRGPGFARYVCGIARPGVPEVGGEIIVRNCPKPCGEEVRTAYRKSEEAWGLAWSQVGDSTFAETSRLNGQSRYGLVVVGWWHSKPEGPIDREIVLRMTAVGAQVSEVRKVANGIRDTVSF
jgi:hypothetical protein